MDASEERGGLPTGDGCPAGVEVGCVWGEVGDQMHLGVSSELEGLRKEPAVASVASGKESWKDSVGTRVCFPRR